jgi:protein tyrosine phosphatase
MEEIYLEYDRLSQLSQEEKRIIGDKCYSSALRPCNLSKNRYKDVLPLEETRVKLFPTPGVEGSDYINANHIKSGKCSYIACQAPLPNTINDFWRMVWEQKTHIIVMLTRIVEGGRTKAHPYWPEPIDREQQYGEFLVSLLQQTQPEKGVIVRQLQLQDLLLGQKRFITHYQYTEWPDNGTPQNSRPILHIINEINALCEKGSPTAPIVVHCSAGVGRAGTFICIHIILSEIVLSSSQQQQFQQQQLLILFQQQRTQQQKQQIRQTFSLPQHILFLIPVKDTLLSLRKQRRGMVQTFEQYKFIYQVIFEAFLMKYAKNLFLPSSFMTTSNIEIPIPQSPHTVDSRTPLVEKKRYLFQGQVPSFPRQGSRHRLYHFVAKK